MAAPGMYTFDNSSLVIQAFPKIETFYKEKRLCDIVLKVGEKSIKAHRVIIASSIPYFYSMFTIGMSEVHLSEITLNGVDPDVFEIIINYAYTGKISINMDTVFDILEASSYFQVTDIWNACVNFLRVYIDEENVIEVFKYGERFSCPQLIELSEDYMTANFKTFSNTYHFLELSLKELINLIKRDKLFVKKEEEVYEACLRWLYHNKEERKILAGEVMAHVRLPLLDVEFLNIVCNDEIISNSLSCIQLLFEAKNYHLNPRCRIASPSIRTTPRDSTTELFVVSYGIWGNKPSFEIYSPYTEKWRKMEPNFINRTSFGVIAVYEKLLLLGGNLDGNSSALIETYDKRLMSWTKDFDKMILPRENFGIAIFKNFIYICGGRSDGAILNSVQYYCIKTETWFTQEPMRYARDGCKAVFLNDVLYVIGGSEQNLASGEVFIEKQRTWHDIRPMNVPRTAFCIATLNEKIYVYGGFDGQESINSMEVYDPKINQWTMLEPMNHRRFGGIGCSFLNKIYAIGGNDSCSELSSVEVYDPKIKVWSMIQSMNEPKWYGGAGVI